MLEDYAAATGARVYGPLGELHVVGPTPLAVTPDAFEVTADGRLVVVEVKTDVGPSRWGPSDMVVEAWTDEARLVVREDYAAQCYALLIATGLDEARLVVRRSLDDLRWYTIRRDADTQARMLESCSVWWARHVVDGAPPVVDDSMACAEALRRLYPPTRHSRTATEVERRLGVQAGLWREAKNHAEAQERLAKSTLLHALAGDSITWPAVAQQPAGRATLTTHNPPQLRVSLRKP